MSESELGPIRLYRTICVGICLLMAALWAHAQQVYKCTKDGKTSFQQVPCEGADITKMAVPKPTGGGLPWDGLRPGMAQDEFRRAVAGTQPEGDRLFRKQGLVIAGVSFDAEYHFDGQGRLQFVFADKSDGAKFGLLNLNGNDANQADFEKLTAVFRAKYGSEASKSLKNRDTGFPGLSASADWSVDGIRIFISVSPVTATTSMLRLGYNPARQR
jgi:hypothetical protein